MAKKCILVVTANPDDTSQVRTDRFVSKIQDALEKAEKTSEYTIQVALATDLSGFLEKLEKHNPTILHLVGHGDRLDNFVFETDAGGREFAKPEKLASCLHSYADTLECVVISACHSQKLAQEITKEIPYAIGYDDALEVEVAKDYSYWFYFYLASGNGYQEACLKTEKALGMKIPKEKMPKLFIKGQNIIEPAPEEKKQEEAISITQKTIQEQAKKVEAEPTPIQKPVQKEEKQVTEPIIKPTTIQMKLQEILSIVETEQLPKAFSMLDAYQDYFGDKFAYANLKRDFQNDKFGMLEAGIRQRLTVFISIEKEAIEKGSLAYQNATEAQPTASPATAIDKEQLFEQIDNADIDAVLEVFEQNKTLFKGFQSFRDEYLYDKPKGNDFEHYKKRLKTFINSKMK